MVLMKELENRNKNLPLLMKEQKIEKRPCQFLLPTSLKET